MSVKLTNSYLQGLGNPQYEIQKQKAAAKRNRAMNRLSNEKNLEFIVNEIYSNIIESAKKGDMTHSTTIIEDGSIPETPQFYFNEINANSNVDVSGNYILDIFSNPILVISENNLYDISDGNPNNVIISNMTVEGEIDISGTNIVVDASNNVLFKVVGDKILDAADNELGTITEDKLSSRVLTEISNKFESISATIESPMLLMSSENPVPVYKSLVFDWSVPDEIFDNSGDFTGGGDIPFG
jgi:hypothetical protein